MSFTVQDGSVEFDFSSKDFNSGEFEKFLQKAYSEYTVVEKPNPVASVRQAVARINGKPNLPSMQK